MQKVDTTELRRLHEAATKGVFWQEEVAFGEACKANLPALLDELEAARNRIRAKREKSKRYWSPMRWFKEIDKEMRKEAQR